MNFIEALKLAKSGKKIRLKKWSNTEFYLCSRQDHLYYCDSKELCSLNMTEYASLDWEIYEEQARLHTFDKAIIALKNGKTIKRHNLSFNYSIGSSSNPSFKIHDVLANDWVIVENKEKEI